MSAHTGQPGRLMRHVLLSLPVARARARGRSGPLACSGSAGLLPAGPHAGPDPGTPRCSTAGAVAVAAHQDLRLAAGPRTPIRPSRPRGASCSAAGPAAANPRCASRSSPHSACCARCAEAVDERRPPVQYFCALCSARWGAVAQATATSFGRRTRLDAQARSFYRSAACSRKIRRRNRPTDAAQRAPLMLEHHCRSLSTAAGGRRIRRTNDRRGGKSCSQQHLPPGRSAPHRCIQRYKDSGGDGSASVSETRVNFRERQRQAHRRHLLDHLEAELARWATPPRMCQSKRVARCAAPAAMASTSRWAQGLAARRQGDQGRRALRRQVPRHGNDDTLSAEDMALGYKQMIRVEQAWRDMKSTLDMRPVFHWAPHRIHSHVAITVLSLLLERTVEQPAPTPAQRLDSLRRIQLAQLLSPHALSGRSPNRRRRRQVLEILADQASAARSSLPDTGKPHRYTPFGMGRKVVVQRDLRGVSLGTVKAGPSAVVNSSDSGYCTLAQRRRTYQPMCARSPDTLLAFEMNGALLAVVQRFPHASWCPAGPHVLDQVVTDVT